jgi:tricarballylate dehydrogenase
MRVTRQKSDPELAQLLVSASFDTMRWMTGKGVRWELSELFAVRDAGVVHYSPGAVIQARGAGIGLTYDLFKAVESRGIPIAYESPVSGIERQNGRVTDVRVAGAGGERSVRARAVILAAGGFEADEQLRGKHLGERWRHARVRGSYCDTGEVLLSALEAGAQPFGDWSGCHATPIDSLAPSPGDLALTDKTNRLSYLYGVLVNQEGKRFVDEGETFASHTYAKTGRAVLDQSDAVAYQLFDQKTVPLLETRYSTGRPVTADTIEGLASQLGLQPDVLVETVRGYNASAAGRPFNPTVLDGKSTTGLDPAKSNWAVPIDSPPYVAYGVTCGFTFTYGGLRIDTEARVLDDGGQPIPGLFATGELTGGFFYHNYPGGSGLMRGAVFGRIAGKNAAARP